MRTRSRRRPTLSASARRRRSLAWTAVAAGASLAASTGVKLAMNRSYKAARGKKPPQDALARGTSWPMVIGWSVATAVVVALVQVAAERGAAGLFERVSGRRPPRE